MPTNEEWTMQAENAWAFKEWAVVCAALRSGRQSLILRKGGIHEGRDGFQVAHREFWLFPTRFHQEPGEIIAEAVPLLEQVRAEVRPAGTIGLGEYAVVEDVIRIEDEILLPRLVGLHVWSDETLRQRFHYKQTGLFALVTRIYRLPQPIEMPDSPHFGGCRSWVDLPRALSTEGLEPVLTDDQFANERARILMAVRRTAAC